MTTPPDFDSPPTLAGEPPLGERPDIYAGSPALAGWFIGHGLLAVAGAIRQLAHAHAHAHASAGRGLR